ncbi:MAG: alpha/beta fold hydrolase [Desulfobacteraceae bacterium]|jgi:haloalkane dehalogenase
MVTFDNSVDTTRFKELYPFQSNFLDCNGLAYHYIDEGEGEPILMLHGNPTWSFYYRELVKAFAPNFRTIVPDHMGCGLSAKPGIKAYDFRLKSRVKDLDTLMTHLKLDRKLTLIVHDWGGMIGLTWAIEHLEQIKRIVVLNTSGFLPPAGKPIPVRLKLIRNIPFFGAPAVLGLNLFVQSAVWMCPYKPLPAQVKYGLTAPYRRFKNRLATLKFVQDIPLDPQDPSYAIVASTDRKLHQLNKIPMLIIWGAHDFVFDRDYYDEWQRRFPNAQAHYLRDAGHYLLEDAPLQCITLIQRFFQRHP